MMSNQGVPVEEIARLAGHASSRTTEVIYRRELRPVMTTGAEVMDQIFRPDRLERISADAAGQRAAARRCSCNCRSEAQSATTAADACSAASPPCGTQPQNTCTLPGHR
jgi:hypothetical protein